MSMMKVNTIQPIDDSTDLVLKAGGATAITIDKDDQSVIFAKAMTMPRNAGLVVKQVPNVTDDDVDIDADFLTVFDTNNLGIVLSTVNLTMDSLTDGANGLDTGDFAATTWYYLYVIYNATTATTACLASTSATAPAMPSGYTFKKLVGAVYCVTNTADVVFTEFNQIDNYVKTVRTTLQAETASNGTVSIATVVPTIAKQIILEVLVSTGTTTNGTWNIGGTGSDNTWEQNQFSIVADSTSRKVKFPAVIALKSTSTLYHEDNAGGGGKIGYDSIGFILGLEGI